MTWNNSFYDDGKLADDSISDRFTDAATSINNLDGLSSMRGTFNERHSASIVGNLHGAPSFFINTDANEHVYNRAAVGGFGTNIIYPGFDVDTASESLPLPGNPSGWIVIGHPGQSGGSYTGGLAKIAFSSGNGVPLHQNGMVQGVLVLFNCEILDADDDPDMLVHFCIQADIGGTWRTLAHTERAVHIASHRLPATGGSDLVILDVPIATLVSYDVYSNEPPGPGHGLRGIRACVSLENASLTSYVKLGRWNLTAIPLRAKVT